MLNSIQELSQNVRVCVDAVTCVSGITCLYGLVLTAAATSTATVISGIFFAVVGGSVFLHTAPISLVFYAGSHMNQMTRRLATVLLDIGFIGVILRTL